jgi:hypothetical protein
VRHPAPSTSSPNTRCVEGHHRQQVLAHFLVLGQERRRQLLPLILRNARVNHYTDPPEDLAFLNSLILLGHEPGPEQQAIDRLIRDFGNVKRGDREPIPEVLNHVRRIKSDSQRDAPRRPYLFLRSLFREGRLTPREFNGRQRALKALAAGKLRPRVYNQAETAIENRQREESRKSTASDSVWPRSMANWEPSRE